MEGFLASFISWLGLTLVLLLCAIFFIASRILYQRRLRCPVRDRDAEVLFEHQKSSPWADKGQVDVVECSLVPHQEFTCGKSCLGCRASTPPEPNE